MARLFKIVRLTKVFRISFFILKFKKTASRFLNTNGYVYVLLSTLVIIDVGSVSIYYVERGITIGSFADAIWWTFVTVTTVGYGDISPATGIGRIIASILMLTGIGFIGMLSGTIATYFISPKKEIKFDKNKILDLSSLDDEKYRAIISYVGYLKNN
jgi:voltage-gated potassium channel